MKSISVTSLRKDLFNMIDNVIKYNEILNVNTKNGEAVIMSKDDYNSLIATIEISSNPKLKEKIIAGMNTPIEDCIDFDKVDWKCIK